MLKPLQLGSLTLPTNLIQGPLAGFSCAPFRRLIHEFGGVGYATTEMISAYELARDIQQPKRYIYREPKEGLLCFQISGNDVSDLSYATEKVMLLGADLIDLNCGCPQRKIRKKGHGSKLLSDPESLYQLLGAMCAAADVPMSAKIRVDGDSGEAFNREVVDAIQLAGVDFMIVHGRHWKERYDVPVRADEIARIVQYAKIPVIANGDVSDYASFQSIMQQTQAAGVMISQASIGRPWLFAAITAAARENDFTPPSSSQIRELLFRHVFDLAALDGEYRALLQARKLAHHYCQLDAAECQWATLLDLADFLNVDYARFKE